MVLNQIDLMVAILVELKRQCGDVPMTTPLFFSLGTAANILTDAYLLAAESRPVQPDPVDDGTVADYAPTEFPKAVFDRHPGWEAA